jgi:hypothetical protein
VLLAKPTGIVFAGTSFKCTGVHRKSFLSWHYVLILIPHSYNDCADKTNFLSQNNPSVEDVIMSEVQHNEGGF